MDKKTTYYSGLITRYFSGEIHGDELCLLSEWLKQDPKNEEAFKEYQKTWQLIEKQHIQSSVNINQEWEFIHRKIENSVSVDENEVKVVSLNQDKSKNIHFFRQIWKVAASVAVLLVSSFLLYFYFSKPANITVTSQSTTIEQTLPDGSIVSLHAGSQIIYPEKFASNHRNVELKGEAYFKVAHDKTKPFVVASGDARVEVLGTQFNVNTHSSDGAMEVVLTSGKVSVYYNANPKQNVLLMPGEKAELIVEQKQIRKSANTDPNYMAWKTLILKFENENLAQVISTLQKVYQTPILLSDTQLAGCRVTASFNNQTLESVLEVLKQTLDLQISQKGNVKEVAGKGCK
ncbi:MAG: FecR family protein [Bacteroidales bacterium]